MKIEAVIRSYEVRIAPRSSLWQHEEADNAAGRNRPSPDLAIKHEKFP